MMLTFIVPARKVFFFNPNYLTYKYIAKNFICKHISLAINKQTKIEINDKRTIVDAKKFDYQRWYIFLVRNLVEHINRSVQLLDYLQKEQQR